MRGAVFAAAVLMAGACAADSWTLARRTADSPQPEAQAGRQEWACCEMETNAIDLLVVFDASACRWLGEHGTGHEQYAETCIKDLNRSLSYTEIDRSFSFRLAGVLNLAPIDFGGYELSDVVATFSPALSAKRLDGHVAEKIRLARDDTHADVVAILTLGRTPNIYGYSISLKKENI